ncbi:MAG: LysR substrate-binding domain-containing protein [Pseudomonadota bacterium]|nr:LysR substrate-binding domain-containing protein [Pseudomonadota bacterium]
MARRVGQVRRVLVASPAYLAGRGTPREPADLAQHDVIFTSGRPGPVEWRFQHGAREHAVRLSPRLAVNQVDAALFAAREGRGVASALSYQVRTTSAPADWSGCSPASSCRRSRSSS